jgi:hypothetical protein
MKSLQDDNPHTIIDDTALAAQLVFGGFYRIAVVSFPVNQVYSPD